MFFKAVVFIISAHVCQTVMVVVVCLCVCVCMCVCVYVHACVCMCTASMRASVHPSVCYQSFGIIVHIYYNNNGINFVRYSLKFISVFFREQVSFVNYGVIYLLRRLLVLLQQRFT